MPGREKAGEESMQGEGLLLLLLLPAGEIARPPLGHHSAVEEGEE
jgi:hypothetical protein